MVVVGELGEEMEGVFGPLMVVQVPISPVAGEFPAMVKEVALQKSWFGPALAVVA